MALVHTNYHTNPLESSRLSQRELLARIFGHHGTEGEHNIDEDSSSDSGSDYEMEECHEGMMPLCFLVKVGQGDMRIVSSLSGTKILKKRIKEEWLSQVVRALFRCDISLNLQASVY